MNLSNGQLAAHAINITQDAKQRTKLIKLFSGESFQEVVEEFGKKRIVDCIKNLEDMNIKWVTIKCENYPEKLLALPDPPYVLYYKGNFELFNKASVSIVGLRNCTPYGKEQTKRFAHEFSSKGIIVVSGLADGIDTAAHLGAGAYNTIAVLGNGLNVTYPAANESLQKEIAEKGLLVSEYLPNVHPTKFTFPHRNRIVAALGKVLLITEAAERSGTMITKNIALDIGKEIYAIPGPIDSSASYGTNWMIKESMAHMATSPADVLSVFNEYIKDDGNPNLLVQISFEEKAVLGALDGRIKHFDDLMEALSIPVAKLSSLLTNMEVGGLIKKLSGNYYKAG